MTATIHLFPTPTKPTRPTTRRDRTYVPNGQVGRRLRAAQSLQLQIQQLNAQLDEHRSWLLAHMQRHDLDKLQLDQFVVTRKIRHNWAYSPETERDALALRARQRWEQAEGLALDAPTVYIAMTTQSPSS